MATVNIYASVETIHFSSKPSNINNFHGWEAFASKRKDPNSENHSPAPGTLSMDNPTLPHIRRTHVYIKSRQKRNQTSPSWFQVAPCFHDTQRNVKPFHNFVKKLEVWVNLYILLVQRKWIPRRCFVIEGSFILPFMSHPHNHFPYLLPGPVHVPFSAAPLKTN